MELVDFGTLRAARHAEAATILRDALAHLPSAYNEPGEAEAEVELRRNEADWLGYAALKTKSWSAGSVRSGLIATAGRSIPWSWRRTASAVASVRP